MALEDIANGAALGQAFVRLYTQDIDSPQVSACSASFVSDAGHILTAGHCVENCLMKQNQDYLDPNPRDLSCTVKVNGELMKARVVLSTRCRAEHLNCEFLDACSSDEKARCGSQGDITILMPEKRPTQFKCLPIQRKKPALNEEMTRIGVPGRTYRAGDRRDADGKSVQVSLGHTVNSLKCTLKTYHRSFLWAVGAKLAPSAKSPPSREEVDQEIVRIPPGYIQSTNDSEHGGSGGPLINWAGEIVAVSSVTPDFIHHNHLTECEGAVFSAGFDHLDEMAAEWGTSDEVSHMKCSDHAAIHQVEL